MLTIAVVLIIAYVIIAAAAFLMQKQMIYHPNRMVVGDPLAAGLKCEEIWLTAADGNRLLLWYLPKPDSRKLVVFFHGNAENVSMSIGLYQTLQELGASVLAVEYRGYLTAPGAMSERAVDLDIAALADYLRQRWPADSTRIIAMGRSLGGAMAVKLGGQGVTSGLILESTFSSMTCAARAQFPFLPVSLLLTEKYDSEPILRTLDLPVLVIHSRADEVVSFQCGKRLIDIARGPKRLVELQGGHNTGADLSWSQLRAAYAEFLDSI
ncbi:MAG: alpha/beta hydrolase [candidate division Zixibacteria bacterium]|nr:alpha/beta hydrolase [candidate division Zixibacteria bacterium]